MKKTINPVPRWRAAALACTTALLLAGCGAANDGGLSNGPQMAAATTNVPGNAQVAAAEPAAAPEMPVADPAPAMPEAAAATAQPAPQGDAFAMKGYSSAQAASGAEGGSQGGAAQDAGAAAPADAGASAQPSPADGTAQASAFPVPDGANRSYGPSGAGFAAADTEPEMCKYGGCSFR